MAIPNALDKDVDRGYAYVILLACSLGAFINQMGIATSGLLYVEFLEKFRESNTMTSIPMSILLCMSGLVGIFTTPLINHFGSRTTIMLGYILVAIGYLTSSFATSIHYLIFSYGLLAGIGHGMIYTCVLVPIQSYFNKKRPIATAICLAGQGGAYAVSSPVLHILLNSHGLHGTFIAMSTTVLHGLVLGALMKPNQLNGIAYESKEDQTDCESIICANSDTYISKEQSLKLLKNNCSSSNELNPFSNNEQNRVNIRENKVFNQSNTIKQTCPAKCMAIVLSIRKSFVSSIFCDKCFTTYLLAMFIVNIGQITPYTYLPDKAKTLGISKDKISIIVSSFGVAQIFGRITSGLIANVPRVNRLLQLSVVVCINGMLMILSPLCKTFFMLMLYAICFNVLYGGAVGVAYTVLVDLTGVDKFPTAIGTTYTVIGLAYLIANPLTGYLYDATGSYDIPFYINGSFIIMASILFFIILIMKKRDKRKSVTFSTERETNTT